MQEPDPAGALSERVTGFVEGWLDGAIERGVVALGDLAFVAEMRYADEGGFALGWAYDGDLADAGALLTDAAEATEAEAAEPGG